MGELIIEQELGQLIAAARFADAATRTLETYGPELYGFLVHQMGGETDAAEVFSQVAEDFWRGLPRFCSRCSVRTWLYVLTRHAMTRFRRSPWNRGGRTGDSALDAIAASIRSRTPAWARSEVKDRWRALRDSLADDDRMLLVLRVDRGLSWNELALVMLGSESAVKSELAREASRLRKRFQILKNELRQRAKRAGLLEGPA